MTNKKISDEARLYLFRYPQNKAEILDSLSETGEPTEKTLAIIGRLKKEKEAEEAAKQANDFDPNQG